MAKIKKTAEQALKRAQAVGAQARRQGGQLATQLARKTAKQAGRSVARLRRYAVAEVSKVADKVSGRARKRKRAKVVAAVVGAAAVVAAAGVAAASRRR